MGGSTRWCLVMGAMAGLTAGCHGAPWSHVAPTPEACVQRSAIKQEMATLDAKLKKGEFPTTPPVLVAASAADIGAGGGGPMGGSVYGLNIQKRAEGASASDGGASPQATSSVALAQAAYAMDENAARDRKTVANVAGITTAGSATVPAEASLKQAAERAPATKAQAQARMRLLQKRLWDLPSGSSCAKLTPAASSASR